MKTFDARILVKADGDDVGQMLERLAAFAKSLTDAEHVRVMGYQWDGPENQEVKVLDIRKPSWKNYTKGAKP